MANYFAALARGRAFSPNQERPGWPAFVAGASDEYWRKTGSDPSVIGSAVRINSRPFTIVGVAPLGFAGSTALVAPEFWVR